MLADSPFLLPVRRSLQPTAIDSSVNGFNGFYTNGVTLGAAGDNASGTSDTAATFGGSPQYCVAGTGAMAMGNYVANSSYEFVYATTSTNYGMMVVGGANSGSTVAFQVFLDENLAGSGWQTNTSRLYIRDSGNHAYGAVFTNAAIQDGHFHHLVWTFTTNGTTTAAAYFDGVPQTLAISTGAPVTFGPLVYPIDFAAYSNKGNNTAPIDYTVATLDEAAFYTNALTPLQVTNHYLALITPSGPAHNDLWTGAVNNNWDSTTANWTNSAPTNTFANYDGAIFDDTSSQFSVNLPGNVLPFTMTSATRRIITPLTARADRLAAPPR